jgi:hypothetical protein
MSIIIDKAKSEIADKNRTGKFFKIVFLKLKRKIKATIV